MANSASWKLILKMSLLILFIIVAGLFLFSLIGSRVTKNIDTYTYNLPFKKGTKHRIVQGYGGLFSHKNIAALDFYMPEGTPVCAAREGVIYTFEDDSDEGGPFPGYEKKANFIIVKHNDGSFGCYWHLKKNGVVVKSGLVAKGQLIGYSGSTGFTLSPHLHFSVKRKLDYEKDSFVRTRFNTSSGIKLLENGKIYERLSD
ncbi:M23 family metallopeptidase [Ferruginibacter sp.]|uniref:M23 family metallopeptidase n=1 Tax=Ferruginibacter sp. TaxID=1940288 RepID=UPI0019AEE0B9|nr:M23 family metallopeptidase [Ferruginibacter sp.]MBC7629426.1 M23 family metallopeptidase [Ferruginibacter sp.]